MEYILLIVKRNLLLFFRNRLNLFFALLAPVILLFLYVLFLGNLQVNNLENRFPDQGNETLSAFVTAWVFAGIIMVTSVTASLGAMNTFVDDVAAGRFKDFLVSPLKRAHMIFGYTLSALIISLTVTVLVGVIGQGYMLIRGYGVMGLADAARCFACVVLSCLVFSSLASFAVTFIKNMGAFSAFSTIVGTSIGFLAGAYIPNGTLTKGVVNIINVLPFAQVAALIRKPYVNDALSELTQGQQQAVEAVEEFYGISVDIGSVSISPLTILVILLLLTVVFTILGARRFSEKLNK